MSTALPRATTACPTLHAVLLGDLCLALDKLLLSTGTLCYASTRAVDSAIDGQDRRDPPLDRGIEGRAHAPGPHGFRDPVGEVPCRAEAQAADRQEKRGAHEDGHVGFCRQPEVRRLADCS